MTAPCRPDPRSPRPDATEQTADYLARIAACPCRPEWRQPGGLCGGCGRDGFGVAEATETAKRLRRSEVITKTGPTCPADIVRGAVQATAKKADIPDAVVEALEGYDALAPWPGETFVVWLTPETRDRRGTRIEELPGGIEVEYWGATPIAFRFPAGAEIEVTG